MTIYIENNSASESIFIINCFECNVGMSANVTDNTRAIRRAYTYFKPACIIGLLRENGIINKIKQNDK